MQRSLKGSLFTLLIEAFSPLKKQVLRRNLQNCPKPVIVVFNLV